MPKTFSTMAIIEKVQTTIDGGIRVSLDFSANEVDLAQQLLSIKLTQGKVAVAFQKLEDNESPRIEVEKIEV